MEWTLEDGNRETGSTSDTWRKTFHENLSEMEINGNEANKIANDCTIQRKLVAQCPERNSRR